MTNDVTDRQSFIVFLNQLLLDYNTNKDKWENKDLESFLEAMGRYAEGVHGYYKNTKQNVDADNASWKIFTDILIGATMYE